MSTVSTINLPAGTYQVFQPATQSSSTAQALVALGSAIRLGSNVDTQTALASLQQGLADSSGQMPTPPFPTNQQANSDYADLVNSVQSGNLASAQAALTKLQLDLKEPRAAHHSSAVPVPTTTIDTSDSAALLQSRSTSGNYVNVTV